MEVNLENNTSKLPSDTSAGVPKDRRREALGNLSVLPDEILCAILLSLTPLDVARLSCVSSVMYILCNEEPLWMSLCLNNVNRHIEYKGSWKKTALHQLDLPNQYHEACRRPLHFDGFNSLFLYRRLYRCYTSLNGFSFDRGTVERKENINLEEFQREYDGWKPVLISGLADNWPARKSWTTEQLLAKYGEAKFRLSQRSSKKITMKFKDYLSYMQIQHDEDPLYIFDEKFGDSVPDLLKDYSVPHLFQEDYFDILDSEKRPPFRWLIIGPERSGASWHVDPALTSAWNTLISGRKRWALYPPGRVPSGVTVHVNEEDGDVNIDGPSSLQWWLEFYPLLPDAEKPIECTQLPGETIFVPSGWWHCVLNLETTIAVTQNFVNSKNFEFVCLDMSPGYRHKGVCRAGVLALDEGSFEDLNKNVLCLDNKLSSSDPTRKEKRLRMCQPLDDSKNENDTNSLTKYHGLGSLEFSYDINFLAMFLDKERDHYNSLWASGNCIGQREMREWLWKLWLGRPGLRDLIWKGACIALNAGKWFERVGEICAFHGFPSPLHDEKLPVGLGSNPVYLVADYAIKIFVEDGLEASLYGLGTELQFYSLLHKVNSPLKNYIPGILASGILLFENGLYTVFPWDGKGIPEVIANCNFISMKHKKIDYPFGVWSKKHFECQNAGIKCESGNSGKCSLIWPYIVTKRCRGEIYAELRDALPWEDTLNLASFLGEKLRNLHLVPCPSSNASLLTVGEQIELPHDNRFMEIAADKIHITAEWNLFISTLNRKRKDLSDRLTKWGDPIPCKLIEKVAEYIPHDFAEFLDIFEEVCKSCTWVHSDVMDDNIYMTQCSSGGSTYHLPAEDGYANCYCSNSGQKHSWHPSHILDFSNLSIGDPILDLIPIHLDIFRGDSRLLKQFLKSYGLALGRKKSPNDLVEDNRFHRLSYRAMCYCILHDDNILGAIFSLWKELKMANSWEEVEETVWGDLNDYTAGF